MNKELNIYSADIHIHTPASKCYEGTKDEAGYIEIIKAAKRKKLDIIAISDHNSIEGYAKLIEQKSKILNEIDTLNTLSDSEQAHKRIKELKKILSLFDGILILPAIEFEVNNGIHLLVVFNPKTSLTRIRQFLEDGGYNHESFGFEKSETISNWSIFDLYEEVKKYDCLVIDGHTDSDKGILNTIPKGNTRAHAFKNTSLSGVCYKNEKQRKQLENTIKTSKEYYRNTPLAFIKSSDAHKPEDVGKSKSFFKLEKLDWDNFKKAFENPTEYIFTNYPKVQDILDNILKKENYLTVLEADKESLDNILKSICALNNSNGGYILIGVDDRKTLIGINVKDDKYENFKPYINLIFEGIQKIQGVIKLDFNAYPLQHEKVILVFKIFGTERLVDINDNGIIYSYDNNSICVLSAANIQKTIENKTIKDIEKQIHKSLIQIETHASKVKSSLKSLPIVSSFFENSIPLISITEEPTILKVENIGVHAQKALIEYGQENSNGKSRGNIFFFEEEISPRFKDSTLRFSMPKFYSKGLNFESENSESVYIVPGGGVFYSKRTVPHYNPKGLPIIQLNIEKESNYSTKFLCAYLKSSFFLWLLANKHDNTNIYEPEIFNELQIPKLDFKNSILKKHISTIESEVDEILKKESLFLKIKLDEHNSEDEVMSHNSEIDVHVSIIDKEIYELLKIDDETRMIIEKTLTDNQIYFPINN